MITAAFTLLLAAAPSTSSTSSTSLSTPAERLAWELSATDVAVQIDDAHNDTDRCHANRLVLTLDAHKALRAAMAAVHALPESMPLAVVRHGVDEQKRRCRSTSSVVAHFRPRRALPGAGTPITMSVVGEGFVVDVGAVVVPCRRDEVAGNADVVCARTSTGRVLHGVVDDVGAVIVAAGAP
jgi:hypothetical protein